ncbi:hypothetical protein [Rubidibacter lacunae]|nr:hypothetical protein [Rubidibacter lacunae]
MRVLPPEGCGNRERAGDRDEGSGAHSLGLLLGWIEPIVVEGCG